MTTVYEIDEILKDAQEITKTAIEDNISNAQVYNTPYTIGHRSANHWLVER